MARLRRHLPFGFGNGQRLAPLLAAALPLGCGFLRIRNRLAALQGAFALDGKPASRGRHGRRTGANRTLRLPRGRGAGPPDRAAQHQGRRAGHQGPAASRRDHLRIQPPAYLLVSGHGAGFGNRPSLQSGQEGALAAAGRGRLRGGGRIRAHPKPAPHLSGHSDAVEGRRTHSQLPAQGRGRGFQQPAERSLPGFSRRQRRDEGCDGL